MITFLFWGQLIFAHVVPAPLFEANCKELSSIPNGTPARPLPYTDVAIRRRGSGFELTMFDATFNGIRATLIAWDAGMRQHVARFANGETWSILGNAQGGLAVQVLNNFTNCEKISAVSAPPSATEIERIWKAVQDVSRGCGNGLVQDDL